MRVRATRSGNGMNLIDYRLCLGVTHAIGYAKHREETQIAESIKCVRRDKTRSFPRKNLG